jgi:hypothetical protein
MARSQKFKLANYDGGLSSHPKPAEAGEFEVGGDATWSMSFKGSFKPSHGSLASWTISQTTTTEKGPGARPDNGESSGGVTTDESTDL